MPNKKMRWFYRIWEQLREEDEPYNSEEKMIRLIKLHSKNKLKTKEFTKSSDIKFTNKNYF